MRPLIGFFLLFASVVTAGELTLVYLVRHTEKVDSSSDADLSETGLLRAEGIRRFFEDVPFDYLFASQFQRTQKTLWPIAGERGIEISVTNAMQPEQLIDRLSLLRGGTALVAGHSNTIPQLICLFGGPQLNISYDDYDDVFLLVLEDGHYREIQRFRLGY